jgi:hypothetical protein
MLPFCELCEPTGSALAAPLLTRSGHSRVDGSRGEYVGKYGAVNAVWARKS